MKILDALINLNRGIGILIDPEKTHRPEILGPLLVKLNSLNPDYLLIGGSTCVPEVFIETVKYVKENSPIPVLLFPGSHSQFSEQADGILFLSLISGRNPEYLIGQQIAAGRKVYQSGIEVISTGYILIDGGQETSVQKVTGTQSLSTEDLGMIEDTAIAAKLMGMQCIYLEAGSGALAPVSDQIIKKIGSLALPIIVGGGIRNLESLARAHDAGANLVVIGNKIEEDPAFIDQIFQYKNR